jgi:hypothetical protein
LALAEALALALALVLTLALALALAQVNVVSATLEWARAVALALLTMALALALAQVNVLCLTPPTSLLDGGASSTEIYNHLFVRIVAVVRAVQAVRAVEGPLGERVAHIGNPRPVMAGRASRVRCPSE